MRVLKEHPKLRIVSVRISDEETELLDQVQKETSKSVSEIMREAIRLAVPQMETGRAVAMGRWRPKKNFRIKDYSSTALPQNLPRP